MTDRVRFATVAALATFVFHLAANPHYGFFRDELYFIICGFHPQWGYVDQPPITPLLAAATQLFGHSLFLLRAVPAAFAAASVYVVCLLVAEFGGGAFAMLLGALCGALSLVLVAFGEKVGPDMVGLWLWPLATLYLVRILKGGDARLWLAVGAAIGFSLESKYSVLFFAVAALLGLLITPQRRALFSWWFVAGSALAVAIALPNFIWQAVNGFPMWELLRNGQAGKNVVLSPPVFLIAELLITGPLLAPVWICGLVWTILQPQLRWLGYTFVILMLMMIVTHGKHYYPADIYPIFFAAGGVAIEGWTARARAWRPAIVAVALLAELPLLPYVEPILPEDAFIAYNKAIGPRIGLSVTVTEHTKQTWMTQDFADMHGWPELAATVQSVYDRLSPDERAKAVVAAQNYGDASAIAFFTKLPVISGHNQYYLWGLHGETGEVLIDINGDCGRALHIYRSAILAARFSNTYVMPYENDMPILVCSGLTKPLAPLWPQIKSYE